MTIRAKKFTPEVLLSAPRRSAGIPNRDASKILYSVSTYSFAEHKKKSEVRVLDAAARESTLVTGEEGAGEYCWLDGEEVLVCVPGENGETKVVVGSVGEFEESKYTAGTIPASFSNVKVKAISKDKYVVAGSAPTRPDGSLYNPNDDKKSHSTGKLYTSLFVRHWDSYVTSNKNSIWYGTLSKDLGAKSGSKYKLSTLTNALKGTGLECPVPPFGGADDFDISSSGLIFKAKDLAVNPATHTKENIYIAKLAFTKSSDSKPELIDVPDFKGAGSSPVFSEDGSKAAFLKMHQDGYESDKNQIFVVPDVRRPNWIVHFLGSSDGKGKWDCSPSSITFSSDNKKLHLEANIEGRDCVFSLPINDLAGAPDTIPTEIVRGGSFSSTRVLDSGKLFIAGSSLIDSSIYSLADPSKPGMLKTISSASRDGSVFGLSNDQVTDIWFQGAKQKVHAWVLKPSNFNPKEKYPLAFLVHGGPQGAWGDSWSTRWNPAVFSEQGYIAIMPNPTGSTGYGQEFCDAIGGQWGGLPYQDLVCCFDYIEKNLDYVDTSRAVGLGASYGGYMMNWIQGNPLGRKFKALVTHDGVFSMTGQLASEELYFPEREFGGKYWEHKDDWLQWDPSQLTGNWATPHLIIHSEKDYRLTISEGLSAFNVLQERGIESQFLMFPDENHWVLKPENSLLWHTTVFDFINKFVGLPTYSESAEEAARVKMEALVVSRGNSE
ncbi:dipeptidyl-peptidase-like protein V precursor [Aulographum hederae CBS 113979]|uniref:Dipeptidyl-peptidase V n=1 Tax=Aulographum hederae CBS 113979 TaxID=1176131 RepID=A0A6G1GZS5_9PEZI|nr:dipeptidyl-peptidase-like protein V precursor [Aulographum hederae CBS 113979]